MVQSRQPWESKITKSLSFSMILIPLKRGLDSLNERQLNLHTGQKEMIFPKVKSKIKILSRQDLHRSSFSAPNLHTKHFTKSPYPLMIYDKKLRL